MIISGAHVMIASKDAEADRAFLRDVLEIPAVDGGGGWLVFGLPRTELGVHPAGHFEGTDLYFICDDLNATIAKLGGKGVVCGEISTADWGRATSVPLPSGGKMGLYEAYHARA
jgi:catechol 2,3-dioxygenase-like lactoylglutathione lyase family enzyme